MRFALLLSAFLLAADQGHTASAQQRDWLGDLFGNINRMNQQIQSNVQRMTEQIQQNVNDQVARANQQVNDALNNIDKLNGTQSRFIGDGSVIITSNGGNSRQVKSGTEPNGQPYYVETENLVVGDTLFHTDRVYNHTSKKLEEHRYTLNLTDPNAKPVYASGSSPMPNI